MAWKPISLAVLICGVLDIVYAGVNTLLKDGSVATMLRGIATGPFGGAAAKWGLAGAGAGLAVHFAIMTVMVLAYFRFVAPTRLGTLSPWLTGTAYGLLLYLVMHGIVLPMRFGSSIPLDDIGKVIRALFPHIALVGLPVAFIAASRPAPAPIAAAG